VVVEDGRPFGHWPLWPRAGESRQRRSV